MRFRPTALAGVFEVATDHHADARGSFDRTYDRSEFAANGIELPLVQCSLSHNHRAGTVRGFHLQISPHEEAKLIQCVRGRVFDAALDLRPGSPTYGGHHAVELSAEGRTMLVIPPGCAHAFQTLQDDTAIMYSISASYEPSSARGVRWDDPAIGVAWPFTRNVTISDRDRVLPLLADYRAGA